MKHSIELTEEQIGMIAEGLSCMAWARDHSSPYQNAEEAAADFLRLKSAKNLCESLESLLPPPTGPCQREVWPKDLKD